LQEGDFFKKMGKFMRKSDPIKGLRGFKKIQRKSRFLFWTALATGRT